MTDSLVQALAALDRLDADPTLDENAALDLIEEAHRGIARGLGLTVFPPSNYPYTTVSDRADANPYSRKLDEVWEMPEYSESFEAALPLAPTDATLVLVQTGARWKAAYTTAEQPAPDPTAWRESDRPVRAIARAALFARLSG